MRQIQGPHASILQAVAWHRTKVSHKARQHHVSGWNKHFYKFPKQDFMHSEQEAWKPNASSEFMTESHKRNSHEIYITITCCTSKMPLCSLGVKSTDSDAVQMHIQVDKRQSIHAPAQRITYRKLEFQWLHVLRWHTWKLQRVRSGENIPNWELYWGHLSLKCWFRLVHDFGQNFRKQRSFRVSSVTVIIMLKENLFCTNWWHNFIP